MYWDVRTVCIDFQVQSGMRPTTSSVELQYVRVYELIRIIFQYLSYVQQYS